MGMFDDIEFTMPCPICGAELFGFQSKDGDRMLQTLTPMQLAEQATPGLSEGISIRTSCTQCAVWVDLKLRRRDDWACKCGRPKEFHDKCLKCHIGGLTCGCRYEDGRWITLDEWRGA